MTILEIRRVPGAAIGLIGRSACQESYEQAINLTVCKRFLRFIWLIWRSFQMTSAPIKFLLQYFDIPV